MKVEAELSEFPDVAERVLIGPQLGQGTSIGRLFGIDSRRRELVSELLQSLQVLLTSQWQVFKGVPSASPRLNFLKRATLDHVFKDHREIERRTAGIDGAENKPAFSPAAAADPRNTKHQVVSQIHAIDDRKKTERRTLQV